jgi:hypothetical protein
MSANAYLAEFWRRRRRRRRRRKKFSNDDRNSEACSTWSYLVLGLRVMVKIKGLGLTNHQKPD